MGQSSYDLMMKSLGLSPLDLHSILYKKDRHSQFLLYMAAHNHMDSYYYKFKEHGISMFTEFSPIRGYTSLYQLLQKPTFGQNELQLFRFIVSSLGLRRKLKDGELL